MAVYHFSSLEGRDDRTAVQAQNEDTPWSSLTKLRSVIPTLQPGDKILFKSGEEFNGYIQLNKAGTADNPITFGSYGGESKPIITSLRTVSGWTNAGNGIWDV